MLLERPVVRIGERAILASAEHPEEPDRTDGAPRPVAVPGNEGKAAKDEFPEDQLGRPRLDRAGFGESAQQGSDLLHGGSQVVDPLRAIVLGQP